MQIIHGDNQVASRQYFLSLRHAASVAGKQIVALAGEDLSLDRFVTATASTSLLGTTNSVFVEGFFARRPSSEKKSLYNFLISHPGLEVVFWDAKDVSAQLKSFATPIVKKFDLPKVIWQFLDSLSPALYRPVLATTEAEQLLALIAGRLHQLIMLKSGTSPAGLAAWQAAKLKSQAAIFTLPRLIAIHASLLNLDYKAKTSSLASDLATALELWLYKSVR